MKKLIQASVVAIAMLMGSYSGALADFEAGKKALEAKDKQLALAEFREAAEKNQNRAEAIKEILAILLFANGEAGVPTNNAIRETISWALELNKMGSSEASDTVSGHLYLATEMYSQGDLVELPLGYQIASKLVQVILRQLNYINEFEREEVISIGEETTKKIMQGLQKGEIPSTQAVNMLEHLARANIALPQLGLGLVFEEGKGGTRADYVKAHMWYSIASANGSSKGRFMRKSIEGSMRPTQITKSQKMAQEWKQKHSKN